MIVNIRPDCCIALRMIALQSWYASEQELWETWRTDVLDITEQLQIMINATTDGSVIITGMKASEEITRLRAENEKLRAALKVVDQGVIQRNEGLDWAVIDSAALRAAAAALKETGDE